jgi:Oxidoreductase family, NAD-binding Rossmann fold/Oxidoreductase family, C-terminal alpha/beta domain
MQVRTTRRRFLKQAAVAGAALSIPAASWSRVLGANDRLRVASIGTGGKGWSDLTATAASPHVGVTALCDIDESKDFLGRAAEKFPQAKRFTDWRKLLDEQREFDAVIVSTPDHMHAPIALPAMQLGKHVQCQKPLTHTVFEARQMRLAAKTYNVVTQMGNQIQSHEAYRTAVKLVHDGVIGKVKEVHSWQAGPFQWMLVDDRPAGSEPIPETLHWDDWLGVAPQRPYLPKIYHSFNWRAWQDFSNGQLGDFGCHILDPVFMALKLTAPLTIRAEAPPINREVWTKWATVYYEFPGTELTAGKSIKVTWYDGVGKLPPRDALGLPEQYALPASGSALLGEKGTLVIPHVKMPKLFPEEKFASFEIPVVPARDHYVSWADACRGEDKTTSHFDYAGPLTETVLLGSIAIRQPGTALSWNADKLELAGSPNAQGMLTKSYRTGWQPRWI